METGNLAQHELYVTGYRLTCNNKKAAWRHSSAVAVDIITMAVLVWIFVMAVVGTILDSYNISIDNRLLQITFIIFSLFFSIRYNFILLISKEKRNGKIMSFFFAGLLAGVFILSATLLRNNISAGIRSITDDVIIRLNTTYGGSIPLVNSTGKGKEQVFIFVGFIITWIAARAIILKRDNLRIAAVLFPVFILCGIGGGKISSIHGVMMAYVVVTITVISGIRRYRSLWGEKKSDNYNCNHRMDVMIRVKVLIVSIPAMFVVIILSTAILAKPLSVPLGKLSDATYDIRVSGVRMIGELLPRLYDTNVTLLAEGVGGGVSGGILGELEGTFYTMKENIKVTCSELPGETVYLKGYVGSQYDTDRWINDDEKGYLDTLRHWSTQGDAQSYVYNIPFLRMAYAVDLLGGDYKSYEPSYISVESMDENITYTYIPYNVYINDYYRIGGGDAYVIGQSEYENTFPWFYGEDVKEVMAQYRKYTDKTGKYSVLDEVEASYEYFVKANDVKYDKENMERLYDLCEEKINEWDNKIKPDMTKVQKDELLEEKIDDVTNFIRKTLWENAAFESKAIKLPEGEDYVNYFLFEKKQGDSTAFASAATIMFRMFDIPARYVEGYVAPVNIFQADENEEYYAILQDDNAHAWVEIYVSGSGWTQVETTPGFEGRISNLDMPQDLKDKEEDKTDSKDEAGNDENESAKGMSTGKKTAYLTIILLFLIIIFLIVRHMVTYRARRGKIGAKDDEAKVKRIFYSFYDVLIYDGFDSKIDTTSGAFVCEIANRYPEFEINEVKKYMNIVLCTHYGPDKPSKEDVQLSEKMYEKLVETVYKRLGRRRRIGFKLWKAF